MKRKIYTYDDIDKEASKYHIKNEFILNSESHYKAALRMGILDEVCSHMPKNASVGKVPHNKKWTKKTIGLETLKYQTIKEFQEESNGAYKAAWRMGILDEVCSHMEISGRKKNKKEIAREALKYDNKRDFQKNSSAYYQAAWKIGILDEVCSHMRIVRNKRTKESITITALKYDSRGQFQKYDGSSYVIAQRMNILDEICSHMKKSCCVSYPEQNLIDVIKKQYPKVQKLRDKKFEIDIYVPELRRGVEFDGKYWHSLAGLRRSHPNWTEKDLKNYHPLKDSWFDSKGIKILHIKEKDWIKDKQSCIEKCFEFLSK